MHQRNLALILVTAALVALDRTAYRSRRADRAGYRRIQCILRAGNLVHVQAAFARDEGY